MTIYPAVTCHIPFASSRKHFCGVKETRESIVVMDMCIIVRFNSQARVHINVSGPRQCGGLADTGFLVYGGISAAPVGLSGAGLIQFHPCGTSPAIRNSHTRPILRHMSHPPFASVTSFLTLKSLLNTLYSACYPSIILSHAPIVELLLHCTTGDYSQPGLLLPCLGRCTIDVV